MYDPKDDGKTHINIYSKGNTVLGRRASPFAFTPFSHPKFGHFNGMEAYWYWIKTGMKHDELRFLVGLQAKRLGQSKEVVPCDNFEQLIKEGIYCKIYQDNDLKELLAASKLPLVHYYCWDSKDGKEPKVVVPKGQEWMWEWFEEIRKKLQNEEKADYSFIAA